MPSSNDGRERTGYDPTGDLAISALVILYLPMGDEEFNRTEITFLLPSGGISIESQYREQVAEFLAWLADAAAIPADGSVVLLGWSLDILPLAPGVTADELLAAHR